jgi:hypothetical protein
MVSTNLKEDAMRGAGRRFWLASTLLLGCGTQEPGTTAAQGPGASAQQVRIEVDHRGAAASTFVSARADCRGAIVRPADLRGIGVPRGSYLCTSEGMPGYPITSAGRYLVTGGVIVSTSEVR